MYRAWAAPCKAKQTAPERVKNVKITPMPALRNENRRQRRGNLMAPRSAGGIRRVEVSLSEIRKATRRRGVRSGSCCRERLLTPAPPGFRQAFLSQSRLTDMIPT